MQIKRLAVITAIAGAGVIVAACGTTGASSSTTPATSAAPTATQAPTTTFWADYKIVASDSTTVANDIGAGPSAALATACQSMAQDVSGLQSDPIPANAAANGQLFEEAFGDQEEGSNYCVAYAANGNLYDLRLATNSFTAANAIFGTISGH